MTIQEFVDRQNEFIGKVAVFHVRWKNYGHGEIIKVERKITCEEEYHVPDGDILEIVEVEIEEA